MSRWLGNIHTVDHTWCSTVRFGNVSSWTGRSWGVWKCHKVPARNCPYTSPCHYRKPIWQRDNMILTLHRAQNLRYRIWSLRGCIMSCCMISCQYFVTVVALTANTTLYRDAQIWHSDLEAWMMSMSCRLALTTAGPPKRANRKFPV